MLDDLLLRYGKPVPRYTSYPTAPHFHPGVDHRLYAQWLSELDKANPISLYLHVPFCAEMCWFCGCHTKVTRRYEPVADFVQILLREIDLVAEALGEEATISHMHWGGGSPTILSPEDLERLMHRIGERFVFGMNAELAMEIDPRTLTPAFAASMKRVGINRASLGVQDLNPIVQEAINRVQPVEIIAGAVNLLRRIGVEQINFDLIYGLPHQTDEDLRRNVEATVEMGADRVAVFGYAHVPWMKSHQKLIDETALPDTRQRYEQAELVATSLMEAGYVRIGLDHFALPNDPSAEALRQGSLKRNFQGYTTDTAQALIGLGPSGIGALPQGYAQNEVPTRSWAQAIGEMRLATTRGFALSDEDRQRRAIIERLMCDMLVDLTPYGDAFAQEIEALKSAQNDGLVSIKGQRIEVTNDGRPFVRSLCAVFDSYLRPLSDRHSLAV